MRKKLKTDHVIADSSAQRFVCRRCGVSEAFKLPQSLTGFAKRGREFIREHQECKAPAPIAKNQQQCSKRADCYRLNGHADACRPRPDLTKADPVVDRFVKSLEKLPALPRDKPCGSCPYRRDVPAGVWHRQEYSKLPEYDRETFAQPIAPFFCHTQDGRLCAGWLGCHEPGQLLAVRLGVSTGNLDASAYSFTTDVPLFGSGAEAAKHGTSAIARPSPAAREVIRKLVRAKVIKGEAQLKGITPHMGIIDEAVPQAPRTACPRCVTLRDPRQPCPTCGAGGRPPRAR